MEKSIIIIGAGITGLSAGCYGQMNGYRTQIFEMHDKPGGLCTSWQRKGYTFDGCIHWLTGTAPGSRLYEWWQELGALPGQEIINMERFYRVETIDGKTVDIYTDIDRLEEQLLELAPEDAAAIKEAIRSMRHLTKLDLTPGKAPELSNAFDVAKMLLKMLPFFGEFRKWGGMTMGEFAERFQNPLLRAAWRDFLPSEVSVTGLLLTMAGYHLKMQGYPIGGSLMFAQAIEKRYLSLGGTVNYKSRVVRILVENDRAVGIQLADGSEYRADYVISAADGYSTMFDMLGGNYADDTIHSYYRDLPITQPLFFIGLGVKRSFADFPQLITGLLLQLEKPMMIGGQEQNWMVARIHNFDPTLAPEGKTVITVMFSSNYAYWESLRKDIKAYKAEKAEIAKTVIEVLDQRFPGLASQVEVTDVATPVTFKRYTGNWQGSFMGWLSTPKTAMVSMKRTLPGLDSFYMVGQWIKSTAGAPSGGLPTCVTDGRHITQIICRKDKKKFVTSTP